MTPSSAGIVAIGHRGADHDVVLAGVAVHQHLPCRQEGHEQRGAMLAAATASSEAMRRRLDSGAAGRRCEREPQAACGPWQAQALRAHPADDASNIQVFSRRPDRNLLGLPGRVIDRPDREGRQFSLRPARPASYSAQISWHATARDQPSETIWCITTNSMWSLSPRRTMRKAASGPCAISNGVRSSVSPARRDGLSLFGRELRKIDDIDRARRCLGYRQPRAGPRVRRLRCGMTRAGGSEHGWLALEHRSRACRATEGRRRSCSGCCRAPSGSETRAAVERRIPATVPSEELLGFLPRRGLACSTEFAIATMMCRAGRRSWPSARRSGRREAR